MTLPFLAPLRRFLRDDRGSVMAEALITMPILIWVYVSLFAFWDGYRSSNMLQKASYAVSDIISRESEVSAADLTGLSQVLEFMLPSDMNATMRVTSVTWDAVDNRYEVLWSRMVSGSGLPALTTGTLQPLAARLPNMTDGDTVVLVETQAIYRTVMNVGLNDMTMNEFIVTRPRFVNRVALVS